MPAFVSPISNPASWTLAAEPEVAIPEGLRYAGYKLRGLRATRNAPADVVMPAQGILRKATDSGGKVFVEVQVNPFAARRTVAALPWGAPTFYMVFDLGTGPTFTDGFSAPASEVLASVMAVTIVMMGQTRLSLDPVLWSSQITQAINDTGGDVTGWQPFATALASAPMNTGVTAPMLLLDHAGRAPTSGSVDLVYGPNGAETIHHLTLDAADGGDLQRTVARMHATDNSIPVNLWGSGATSLRIRPIFTNPFDAQLVKVEDHATAANEMTITPGLHHISYTNLHDWFAAQFATPLSGDSLARFTRGNKVTPLINGPAFFDDLFRQLNAARVPGGGFHLAGWSMDPTTEMTKRRATDPSDLPLTLKQAAQLIGAAGGKSRFLPAQFIQLADGDSLELVVILTFEVIVYGVLVMNAAGVSFVRSDLGGVIILMALTIGVPIYVSRIVAAGGRPFEQNKSAVDELNPLMNSSSRFSPYPATIDDNTVSPPVSDFPFNAIAKGTRHWGVYHQKLSIVKTATGHVAYCGGMDVNPGRLDDFNHLSPAPFYDLHARVEGPAVRDLALTFEQRWQRDGGGVGLAFPTPPAMSLGTPGTDIVQVARTYFAPADASRRLNFAPSGDRTIADTMLKAIKSAQEFIYLEDQYFTPPKEYRDALLDKVPKLRKLIVAMPGLTDQPFGETVRTGFIADLRAKDPGGTIVRIGYPRRRFTVPGNDLRASSGKCVLGEDLPAGAGTNPTIVLGPKARVPNPPFWVAVEGELMWVYDESTDPAPDTNSQRMKIDRGLDTRLVKGGSTPAGASVREHKKGAAATVVQLAGIYVHAKTMIVDDTFLCIGSANLNRRGLFYDGEANVFTMPQALKTAPDNPIIALRQKLWAEMLDLPPAMVGPLLTDPLAAAALFDRNPFGGNRFVPVETFPTSMMLGAFLPGDTLIANVIKLAGFTLLAAHHTKLFDGVIDPTSSLGS